MRLRDDLPLARARLTPRWIIALALLMGLSVSAALSPAGAAMPRPMTSEVAQEAAAGGTSIEPVQYYRRRYYRRYYYSPPRRYYRRYYAPRRYYYRPRYYRRY